MKSIVSPCSASMGWLNIIVLINAIDSIDALFQSQYGFTEISTKLPQQNWTIRNFILKCLKQSLILQVVSAVLSAISAAF